MEREYRSLLIRGASPLGLPYSVARSPLRRSLRSAGSLAMLARAAPSAPAMFWRRYTMHRMYTLLSLALAAALAAAQPAKPRARDLGVAFEGTPGALNAISALFSATVQATEEAIVNALVAGETMRGANGRTVEGLPHDALRRLLKKYGRL